MDIEKLKNDLQDVAKDTSYTYVHDICNDAIATVTELQDRLAATQSELENCKLSWGLLVTERDKLQDRLTAAEYKAQLYDEVWALAKSMKLENVTTGLKELGSLRTQRHSMSAGEADQRKAESYAVRKALGFDLHAIDVAPIDLIQAIENITNERDQLRAQLAEQTTPAESVQGEPWDNETNKKMNYLFYSLASKKWPELYDYEKETDESNEIIMQRWIGFALGIKQVQQSPKVEQVSGGGEPKLSVWYGPMPESNGKENYTAILYRKSDDGFLGGIGDGITIDRSEYPDRVRYEADRMRYMIGELEKEPFILDYDSDKHTGYIEQPSPNKADVPEGKEIQVCKIGAWGSAYDMPETTRAYTYKDQPGNPIASRIGKALVVASKEKYGDQIDQGLSLLKSLYELNLGVFQLPPLKDE